MKYCKKKKHCDSDSVVHIDIVFPDFMKSINFLMCCCDDRTSPTFWSSSSCALQGSCCVSSPRSQWSSWVFLRPRTCTTTC